MNVPLMSLAEPPSDKGISVRIFHNSIRDKFEQISGIKIVIENGSLCAVDPTPDIMELIDIIRQQYLNGPEKKKPARRR